MEDSGFLARPDYRVDILARRNRVTASFDGEVLADSVRTLLVDEQDHGLVFYFPPDDVRLDRFVDDDRTSRCPYKGTATYRRLEHPATEVLVWSYEDPYPEVVRLAGFVAFYQDVVDLQVGVSDPPVSADDVGDPTWVGSSVDGMLEVFDVSAEGGHRYVGHSDGGNRRVVDGSQLLAQAIVAASKELPDHRVRSAHAMFTRAVDSEGQVVFDLDVVHRGRTFAGVLVAVSQGDRRCASVDVLLDTPAADVIRHAATLPPVGSPADAVPYDMPLEGRELRMVGTRDPNAPDDVGPPVLDAWLRYQPIPSRDDLARALVAHFTGHLSISTTMRPHRGVGTALAHGELSTAVMSIGITFHDPVEWDGWLLYHHESTQVGGGMSYVRGQVFTEAGALLASFTQEGMIRAFGDDPVPRGLPVESRL